MDFGSALFTSPASSFPNRSSLKGDGSGCSALRSPRPTPRRAIEEVYPSTLKTRSFPIPACAVDITAGDGHLYLLTNTFVPHTAATRQLRIEVFDTKNHTAKVLAPVDMTMVGSAIAHQALAFGDGTLWLYGYGGPASPEVVQISPSSGAVLAMTNSVPTIGGGSSRCRSNFGGLWLAGGPAGSAEPRADSQGFLGAENSLPRSIFSDFSELDRLARWRRESGVGGCRDGKGDRQNGQCKTPTRRL